ncbi:MAG: hypothetical protein ABIC91_04525 [Nanoarchaeota archaeon]|nr:hypothetical protein [Nanoarchaeota archaeon]MBU1850434.1 hypothetical protein [Nanoarchaeota archaeon]
MFSRKGSLNLSIEAIVILVMAMAVLGLGLGFIRTMFASGTDKLVGELDNINIMQASESNPIVMTNTVKVNKGKYAQLQASVYNKVDTRLIPYDIDVGGCAGSSAGASGITIDCPDSINIPLRQSTNFGCAVKAGTVPGLFTCQMNITSSVAGARNLTGSFFVEVLV